VTTPKRKLTIDLKNRPFSFVLAEDLEVLLDRYGARGGGAALVLWVAFLKLAYERDSLKVRVGLGELRRRTRLSQRRLQDVIGRLQDAGFVRVRRDKAKLTVNEYRILRGPYRRDNETAKTPSSEERTKRPAGRNVSKDETSLRTKSAAKRPPSSLRGEVLHTSPEENEEGTPASATLRGADGPRSRERVSPERSDTATACNGDTSGGDSSGDTARLGRYQGPRRVPPEFAGEGLSL